MTHTCHSCDQPIPAGLAHLRGVLSEQHAYHGHCLDVLRAAVPAAVAVPAQRRGGSLSERLAVAAVERAS